MRRVHSHIMGMFEHQRAAGRFVPVVDGTTLRCKAQLPWWVGHVQEQGEEFYPQAVAVAAAPAAGGGAGAAGTGAAGAAGGTAAAGGAV